MSSLVCYTQDQIPYVWDEVKPLIKRALDGGSNYTLQDIRLGLCTSDMQLWTWVGEKIEAALVTAIQSRDDETWCLLLALGGKNMDQWMECLPIVEGWAKGNGCTELRIYGRSGWKKLGFEIEYTKLVRKL